MVEMVDIQMEEKLEEESQEMIERNKILKHFVENNFNYIDPKGQQNEIIFRPDNTYTVSGYSLSGDSQQEGTWNISENIITTCHKYKFVNRPGSFIYEQSYAFNANWSEGIRTQD